MKLSSALLIAAFVTLPASSALPWGSTGHSVIIELAQRRFEPPVQQAIKELLGDKISLVSTAMWADWASRHDHPKTYNWHFVDIPFEAKNYDPARDCKEVPKGDCVIAAIERLRVTLADKFRPKQQRAEALMFLVHFVGDIHQPLHCIERDHNLGGNKVMVSFFGKAINLHALWDYGIIDRRWPSWPSYAQYLEQTWLLGKDVAVLSSGGPIEWALEGHQIAISDVYVANNAQLSDTYYDNSVPIIDGRLATAALRLAKLLNDALR